MSFWRRDDFKRLNTIWKLKLKEAGFDDLEDRQGNLRQINPRTCAFQSVDATKHYFEALDQYLNEHLTLPKRDRQILELYSEGFYINEIVIKVGWSDRTVRNIIVKHRKIFTKLI